MRQTPINNIIIRCEFIDLLDRLERINFDFVDLNELNNFIYYDIKNNKQFVNTYKIANVINNKETYIFQYKNSNNEYIDIPNAEFYPNIEYDFNLDLVNKTFKKLDEYHNIELHTIINIDMDINIINKKKSLIRKILGC
jgi:hypothetical protein